MGLTGRPMDLPSCCRKSSTHTPVALITQRLRQGVRHRLESLAEWARNREDSLRMLGPQSVLSRGFSYTLNAAGQVIRSADEVTEGEEIRTHLEHGVLTSVVKG